jgi:hypothetical protein
MFARRFQYQQPGQVAHTPDSSGEIHSLRMWKLSKEL